METDHWRTRAIGEAQGEGYTHLRVTCSGCGRITDMPWNLLLRPPRITIDTFIGNIPLCCERCGNRQPVIGVTRQRDSQGFYLKRQP